MMFSEPETETAKTRFGKQKGRFQIELLPLSIIIEYYRKMNRSFLLCAFLFAHQGFTQTGPLDNNLRGPGNIVISGTGNDVDGRDNLLNGYENTIRGNQDFVFGNRNRVQGSYSIVTGDKNNVQGNSNDVDGLKNSVSGHRNIVRGAGNFVSSGINEFGINAVSGTNNEVHGIGNVVSGHSNVVKNFDPAELQALLNGLGRRL